jgi:hypothetical protein
MARALAAFDTALVRVVVVDIKDAEAHLESMRDLLASAHGGGGGDLQVRGKEGAESGAPHRHLGPASDAMYHGGAGRKGTLQEGLWEGGALGRPMTVVLLNKLDTRACPCRLRLVARACASSAARLLLVCCSSAARLLLVCCSSAARLLLVLRWRPRLLLLHICV